MKFKDIKLNTAFQIVQNGEVFIKVRGGCRPAAGGLKYTVPSDTIVYLFIA